MDKCFGIARFAIRPGEAAAFEANARETMAAAQTDLAGTQAYEWFASPDGSQCVVIEIYDGTEAIAHHGRCVGRTIPPLLEHVADKDVTLLGDVPMEMIERMKGKFGTVSHGGKRILGRLDSPAPGTTGNEGGEMIFAIARFAIRPGQAETFHALAEEAFAAVEAREPGTIGYEWFLDEAAGRCTTIDIYRDAEALKAHMANAGPVMARILEVVDSDVEIYGALPDAMRDKFRDGLGTRYVAPRLQGIL